MKKIKLLIPILIVLIGIGVVLIDSSNDTIEDVIYQQSGIDNTSPVDEMIGSITDGDIILCVYKTKDDRLGYSTIKENNSFFNKYSLCTVENISEELLLKQKVIERSYSEQNLDYSYSIAVDTENNLSNTDDENSQVEICKFHDISIEISLDNKH